MSERVRYAEAMDQAEKLLVLVLKRVQVASLERTIPARRQAVNEAIAAVAQAHATLVKVPT